MMRRKKLLSMLLSVGLVCQSLMIPTRASEMDDNRVKVPETGYESALEILEDTEIKYTQELDLATVPQAIDEEKAKEAKHVKRLYQEEKSLNMAVFENEDGSKTLYSFGHPIKYEDEKGDIKDISLDLQSNGKGGYVSKSSDIITTLPESLSTGINIAKEDEDISVTMYMLNESGSKSISKVKGNSDKAIYECDTDTSIEYSLTYNGLKENIIVEKYNGVSEYRFRLNTGGLQLIEKAESLTLVDKNGEDKVCLGDVIIYTANHEKTEYGTMSFETVKEREEYIVTMHIDEDFLKAKDTAYPIIIDPAIEINREGSGATAIEDVTINSASGSNGSATSLYIGRRDTLGVSRIMMKFPGLTFGSIGASDRIVSAYVNIKDLTQTTEIVTVKCYTFAGNEWSASSAKWSNIDPNSITTHLDDQNVHYGYGAAHNHIYTFDITNAVKGWMVGNMNKNKGIVFKLDNSVETGTDTVLRAFASYNRSSDQPYLVVNYNTTGDLPFADNTMYYNNWLSGTYIGYDETNLSLVRGTLDGLGNDIKWEIRKVDGGYIIRSKADTTKYLASPVDKTVITAEMVNIKDKSIPKRCKWTITKLSEGKCLIQNLYSERYLYQNGTNAGLATTLGTEGTTAYRQRVWRYAGAGYYGTSSSSTKKELDNSFTVDTCSIFAGQSIVPTINKSPDNALWADPADFHYSGYDTSKLSYDMITGTFTSISTSTALYSTQITATHRVTGRSKTFSFVVNPKAQLIGVVPYYSGEDMNSWIYTVQPIVERIGYSEAVGNYGSYTIGAIKNYLNNNENGLIAIKCHGRLNEVDEPRLIINYANSNSSDPNKQVDISMGAEHFDEIDLRNIKLCVFAVCKSGYGGEGGNNFPNAAVSAGAETAVGFEDKIMDTFLEWKRQMFGLNNSFYIWNKEKQLKRHVNV